MSVVGDLATIQFLCQKAINVTRAALITTVTVDPDNDREGETQTTLTGAQQAAMLAKRAAFITAIKTLAAGLP